MKINPLRLIESKAIPLSKIHVFTLTIDFEADTFAEAANFANDVKAFIIDKIRRDTPCQSSP